jgi:hypothetical protein
MLKLFKNITKASIIGILLVGVSGITFVIQHDHPIDDSAIKHTGHSHDKHQQNKPTTYHEVHFVKLGSDDNFTNLSVTTGSTSHVVLFVIHPESFDSFPTLHSAGISNNALEETRPPSRDKCILFSSFLI